MGTEKEINDEEAMKAIAEFANTIYSKGYKDCLIAVGIGAGVTIAGFILVGVIDSWKSKRSLKKEIREFNEFVKKEVES